MKDIHEAIYFVDGFLRVKKSIPGYSPDPSEVDAIAYCLGYLEAIVDVPTKHDQNLEMEYWDNLFTEMKESAENG